MKAGFKIIKVLLALVFLAGIFYWIDPAKLKACAANIDERFLAASVALSFAMVAVSTWKWWYLLRLQGYAIPFGFLYRAYFVGYFYSNLLPSNVGGDVARVWLTMKRGAPSDAAVASVFAERFTGMILLLVMAVISPFFAPALNRHPALLVCALAAAGGLLVLALIVSGARPGARFLGRTGSATMAWTDRHQRLAFLRPALVKAGAFGAQAAALMTRIRNRPEAFWLVSAQTVLFYALMLANVAVGFRAFGAWPDAVAMTAVFPAALLLAMVPLTLGNLGITEGAYVYFFGLAGMGAEITLAMGLLLRAKIIMLGLIGMLFHLNEPGPAVAKHDVGSTNTEKH